MNEEDHGINHLLILAEQKLMLLKKLQNSYITLFDSLSEKETDDTIMIFGDNEKIFEQINHIDEQFKPLYSTYSASVFQKASDNHTKLNNILTLQKKILTEISQSNKKLIIKVKNIKLSLKDNIKQVNRQKSIINRYYSSNEKQGLFLDFKEGK